MSNIYGDAEDQRIRDVEATLTNVSFDDPTTTILGTLSVVDIVITGVLNTIGTNCSGLSTLDDSNLFLGPNTNAANLAAATVATFKDNTCVGKNSGAGLNLTDFGNVCVGSGAGQSMSSVRNVCVGFNAMNTVTTGGDSNIAIGWNSMNPTTGTPDIGDFNCCIGSAAGQLTSTTAATQHNTFINTNKALVGTMDNNILIGWHAGTSDSAFELGTNNTNTTVIGDLAMTDYYFSGNTTAQEWHSNAATLTIWEDSTTITGMSAAIAIDLGAATGTTTFNSATGSTTKDTGAVVIQGGLGVEENVYIGGNLECNTFRFLNGGSTAAGRVLTSSVDGTGFWGDFLQPEMLNDANVWTGTNTFNTSLPTSTISATSGGHFTNKTTMDDAIGVETTRATAAEGTNATNIADNVTAIGLNTAKVGITAGQASAITTNTAKVGITAGQASAISANTAKVGITAGQASAITANTAKVTYDEATLLGQANSWGGVNTFDNTVNLNTATIQSDEATVALFNTVTTTLNLCGAGNTNVNNLTAAGYIDTTNLTSIIGNNTNTLYGRNTIVKATFTGTCNTLVGQAVGNLLVGGSSNTIIGCNASPELVDHDDNISIGDFSGSHIPGSTTVGSTRNICIGPYAGRLRSAAYTGGVTDGLYQDNIIMGANSGNGTAKMGRNNVVIGSGSTAVADVNGSGAGFSLNTLINTTAPVEFGKNNILLGYDSGTANSAFSLIHAANTAVFGNNTMVDYYFSGATITNIRTSAGATTVNLLQDPTTLNFGAAAAITMGAAASAQTIDGVSVNLNTATIDSDEATVGLLGTPTTLTIGASATTINMGATNGVINMDCQTLDLANCGVIASSAPDEAMNLFATGCSTINFGITDTTSFVMGSTNAILRVGPTGLGSLRCQFIVNQTTGDTGNVYTDNKTAAINIGSNATCLTIAIGNAAGSMSINNKYMKQRNVAGVYAFINGTVFMMPIFYTITDTGNFVTQAQTSGSTDLIAQDTGEAQTGNWASYSISDSISAFLLMPNWGVVAWGGTTGSGTLRCNAKNNTDNPVRVSATHTTDIESIYVYFNDVEVLKV